MSSNKRKQLALYFCLLEIIKSQQYIQGGDMLDKIYIDPFGGECIASDFEIFTFEKYKSFKERFDNNIVK